MLITVTSQFYHRNLYYIFLQLCIIYFRKSIIIYIIAHISKKKQKQALELVIIQSFKSMVKIWIK